MLEFVRSADGIWIFDTQRHIEILNIDENSKVLKNKVIGQKGSQNEI